MSEGDPAVKLKGYVNRVVQEQMKESYLPRVKKTAWLVWRIVIVLAIITFVNLAASWLMWNKMSSVEQDLNNGTPVGNEGRAATCGLYLLQDVEMPAMCYEPQVMQYIENQG